MIASASDGCGGACRFACRCGVLGALALGSLPLRVQVQEVLYTDGFEAACAAPVFSESFAVDAVSWPAPWVELGDSADVADVDLGEGRLRPVLTGYPLARMYAPVATGDVDVRFRMVLEDSTRQGVGFYVRQNGGQLQNTVPHGAGYAVFVEGQFRGQPGVSLWREEDGNSAFGVAPEPQDGLAYQVHYQVWQQDASTTALRARIWADGDPEPLDWQVEASNGQADLQNVSGGVAVDSWSINPGMPISAHTRIDDIVVTPLCAAPAP